jgi:hypothetical protein
MNSNMADENQRRHQDSSDRAHDALWKEFNRLRDKQDDHEKVDTTHHDRITVLEGTVGNISSHISEIKKTFRWGIGAMVAVMTLAVFIIQVAVEVWHSFRGH